MRIVSGLFKGRKLFAPKGDATRPTREQVRAAVFNICQGLIEETAFLDLFSGSGAVGFEAISRGAKRATFVDDNRFAIEALRKNCDLLGVKQQTAIWPTSATTAIKKLIEKGDQYDMIYIDPPYSSTTDENPLSVKILQDIDSSSLLQKGGFCFLEEGHNTIPSVWSTLKLESLRRYGTTWLYHFKKI